MLGVASVFRRTSVTWVRAYEYSGSNRNASRDAENLENRLISETLTQAILGTWGIASRCELWTPPKPRHGPIRSV